MFDACLGFSRAEGTLPAPEAGHAVWGALQEALACKESGEPETVVFNLCGHSHFDLAAYDDYLGGRLEDYAYPEAAIEESLAHLPAVG